MYAPTAFYFYKAIFTVELLLAEYICAVGLKKRRLFWLRAVGSAVFCIGLAFALPVPVYNAFYSSGVFLLLFAVSLMCFWLCYEVKLTTALFRTVAGYTAQHIAYQIFDLAALGVSAAFSGGLGGAGGAYGSGGGVGGMNVILQTLLRNSDNFVPGTMQFEYASLCTVVAYAVIYPLVYYLGYKFVEKRLKYSDKFELKPSFAFVFIVLFVLFNILMSAFVTYYSADKFDTFYVIQLGVYNVFAAFFTMYFMIDVVYRKQLERDYMAADRLLRQSDEQYKLSKRNVELINMKCHDLKHQIHSVAGGTVDKNTLAEIDNVISIYDSEIRTGNNSLDIILTEKSLYCQKHDIKLYCIVDGKLLGGIADADLYSMFGNILDNAIEAVRPLDKKRRYIDLSVSEINGFVRIKTGNDYDGELKFADGLPKSTKGNDDIHGFGMKSIRHICKKYGAEMNVSAENGKFEIVIMFYDKSIRNSEWLTSH